LEIEEVIFIKLSNYYMHYFLLHSKEEIMTIVLILGKSKHIKKDHLTRCLDGLIMKKEILIGIESVNTKNIFMTRK
jgi:hypothetical protein